MTVQEGALEFAFPGVGDVTRLDAQDRTRPQGMALVDFVVEEAERTLLIEVKDPSGASVPASEQVQYVKRLQTNQLIHDELTPKARDSYTFLHLMARDNKPCLFVVLFGLDAIAHDPAILLAFKDRLLQRIRRETDEPWKRNYVSDCVVLTLASWAKYFPVFPVKRTAAI